MEFRLRILLFLLALWSPFLKSQVDSVISSNPEWRAEALQLLQDSSSEAQLKQKLQLAGFWLHHIDNQILTTGPKLEVGSLKLNQDSEKALTSQASLNLNDSNYRLLLQEQLLPWQNNGYPFAAFRLIDYHIEDSKLHAQVKLEKGLRVSFDSLAVLGYSDISRKLLEREIAWSKNAPYSEAYLQELSDYLGRLEYLQMERAPSVAFLQNKARVYLYLNKRASNLINGVIGLNTDNQGNSTLTGDFRLRLLNVFNRGEAFDLRWQSPGQQSQDLQIAFDYPYLANTPIGLKSKLEIFRQDNSFIKQDFQLAFPYRLARAASLKLGFQLVNSAPLNGSNTTLQVNEVQNLRYVLGLEIDRRNDAIVSTKGYFLDLNLGSGSRNTPEEESTQYLWEGQFAYYQPISKYWLWHQDLRALGLSGSGLRDNELYRLGGVNSLRGFNEWSFFTQNYALMRSEVRYMLGRYDFLMLLFDFAFAEAQTEDFNQWNRHTGLGLGLNFQTKGGIFSLILATGQSNNANYDLRAAKIHLAYVNRF